MAAEVVRAFASKPHESSRQRTQFQRIHKPGDEWRMVIPDPKDYGTWLRCTPDEAQAYFIFSRVQSDGCSRLPAKAGGALRRT